MTQHGSVGPKQHSVTVWIGNLQNGEAIKTATEKIWERYFAQLVRLARAQLHGKPRKVTDEEDAALCALDSFFHRAGRGDFPGLQDRDDLWRLLVTITSRKVINQVAQETCAKRGGGRALDEAALTGPNDGGMGGGGRGFEQLAGSEPAPDFAAMVAEECHRRLDVLDEKHRKVVQLRLEGYTIDEISNHLGFASRTIDRMLNRLRDEWGAGDD